MIYKTFYLCVGIKYPNPHDYYKLRADERLQNWQQELHEQINNLSKKGWELIQISNSLLEGESIDGYGLFKKVDSEQGT